MRKILFRVDYQGVFDSLDVVKRFKTAFEGRFSSYETTFQSSVDLELNNIGDISNTLSIPVKEIQKQVIHRFSENTFGKDELLLDISKYYSVLTVNCVEYANIDDYLSFFSDFTSFLYEVNEFLAVKRLGLRKIGGDIFFSIDDIFENFEKKYFNFDFTDTEFNALKNNYVDVLQKDDRSPIINYIRSFETGSYFDETIGKPRSAYQVVLDFDAYFSEEVLSTLDFDGSQTEKLLMITNHEHLFNLFKMSVTLDFLKKNSNGNN